MTPPSFESTCSEFMPQIISYPSGRDYLEALFNPRLCFKDPALAEGEVALDVLGLPKPISGASASVFTLTGTDGRRWAVKCFTRYIDDQELRYRNISEALGKVDESWRVEFSYLQDGIMCQGKWYPVLKMEWVEASSLISFIETNLRDAGTLAKLAAAFATMARDLRMVGIAHGDLQHGNLLVTQSGQLKLIDYDGMFVPGLAQLGACEKGHVNYQSPARTMRSWGPYLDHFSAWIIYGSLLALSIDPGLWELLREPGDEALLFHHHDFLNFGASRAFDAFSRSSAPELRAVGAAMGALSNSDLTAIPPLDPTMLPPPRLRSDPAVFSGSPPLPVGGHSDSSWVSGHFAPLPLVPFDPPRLANRLIAAVTVLAVLGAVALGLTAPVLDFLAGGAAALMVALFFVLSAVLFRTTAEWGDKNEKTAALRRCQAETRAAARQVSKLLATRADLVKQENKAVGKITKEADRARRSEQAELSKLTSNLTKQIQAIGRQRQRLQSAEQEELRKALHMLQAQYVTALLSRSSIASAKIPGIGPAVVRSLASCGIYTAANFSGIQFQARPNGGRQVYIRRANGSLVHPRGVGERKARDLDAWRRSLERQARATQPTALPAGQAAQIGSSYQQHRQALDGQQKTAEAQISYQQGLVAQQWAQTHASFSSAITAAHQQAAADRANLDGELSAARKLANAALWRRDLAKRQLTGYRDVSYLRYLAKVIGT
jgi:hypothetical protein